MTATSPYDPMSLMRYQTSILSLGAALDPQSPLEAKEISRGALFEAEQLKDLMDRHKV